MWVDEKLLTAKAFAAPTQFDVTVTDAEFLCLGGTKFCTGYT